MSNANYDIADIELAGEGYETSNWARRHMPVLESIRDRFEKEKPLNNVKVAACLHITSETSNLVETLCAGGAEVHLCASNPISTQDPITAHLVKQGVSVYAIHGEDLETYMAHCVQAISVKPHIVIDDGGDLTKLLHTDFEQHRSNVIGGLEETTTGVIRIKNLERDGKLEYPIIAINDSKTKHMFDNRYGTGQSTIDAIMRSTNILLAGKVFVVSGFGMCGRGVAMRAAGLGASVIVTEVDPVRALEAVMEGYKVMSMEEAVKVGDVFVTVTGNKSIIDERHFSQLKDGVLLSKAGHFDCEIDLQYLKKNSADYKRLRSGIEQYTQSDGRRIVVLGEGRLVNLCAAEGHPAEVMDMSFANQALGCEYLVKSDRMTNSVIKLPDQIDNEVADLKLESIGVSYDRLTSKQSDYLDSWEEGTE